MKNEKQNLIEEEITVLTLGEQLDALFFKWPCPPAVGNTSDSATLIVYTFIKRGILFVKQTNKGLFLHLLPGGDIKFVSCDQRGIDNI